MPHYKYSCSNYDPLVHARASGREVDISPKASREVCQAIKGKTLPDARSFLDDVVAMKVPVAFRRYKLKVGHKSQLQGFPSGRFPQKAAGEILAVLDNLEANAEFKGLDTEKIKIFHAVAHRGRRILGYTPRAHGRSSPSFNTLTHIELVAGEA
ncbi:MAG: 50S ribosomal protein L22 [Thaumarchaeota archaeon]|nr:50S ribosomal protein L22 [Nitrososphaerota archaeon]